MLSGQRRESNLPRRKLSTIHYIGPDSSAIRIREMLLSPSHFPETASFRQLHRSDHGNLADRRRNEEREESKFSVPAQDFQSFSLPLAQ